MSEAMAIRVDGLRKKFGTFTALNGLDLQVERGTVHGFLGPNGAGKSTTIRILLGLMRKSGGQVAVLGQDAWVRRVELHSRLAYVPGDVTLWPGMTGGQCLDMLLRMRRLGRGGAAPWRDDVVDRLGLDTSKRAKTYSKGNRQKVALAAAFAAPVDLLILDEPTSGLDPLMESIFQELVAEAASRGTTVLLSSHILAEVERLCQSVTIIREGTTVESGPLSALRERTQSTVTATVEGSIEHLDRIPGVRQVLWRGREVQFVVDSTALNPAIAALSTGHIEALTVEQASLEDLFMRHYARDTAGVGGQE